MRLPKILRWGGPASPTCCAPARDAGKFIVAMRETSPTKSAALKNLIARIFVGVGVAEQLITFARLVCSPENVLR
jgi:hypothetical protein